MPYPDINPHQQLLEQQLPGWTQPLPAEHWQTLRGALEPAQGLPGAEADWFNNAAPDLRETLLASQSRLTRSQQALSRALKGLQQISEFCEPLLQAQLAQDGMFAPVRDTQLLHVQRQWSWLGSRFLYSSERHSLLQAALLNFAGDESFDSHSAIAAPADISVQPITVEGFAPIGFDTPGAAFQMTSEAYQVNALPLTPQAFASSCRQLDLGQRYQEHLQQIFDGSDQARLRTLAMTVQRDRLRVAADVGYLRHALSGNARDEVERLLSGEPGNCWTLTLFGIPVHEVLLIDAGKAGLLLYLPGHSPALQPCKDQQAVEAALAQLLIEPQARRRFLAYLSLDQHAQFLDLLRQNLDASGLGLSDQAWVTANPTHLYLTLTPVSAEVFGFLQDRHLARLKAEARLLAVPTADADAQARKRRLNEWLSLGMDVLTVAGFFVPGVGTLMLAVIACQLLDEAYEGYEAWNIGDRQLALRHLEAVGLNLALIGGLHVAGKVLPKLFNSPLMENLDQVRVADGSRRLWRPELAPYRSPMALPETLQANASGQFEHGGRYFIRIDGHLYEQRLDPQFKRWRIVHPERNDAYQPLLEHNGEGAWHAEHEQPQDWDLVYLIRRLGPEFTGFTDDEMRRATQVCGLSEDALRQVHLRSRPAPPLLADTLARLRAEQQAVVRMAQDATLTHVPLFEGYYNPTSPADPLVDRLLIDHPRLTRPLAIRLVARLAASERSTGQLPAWLDNAARQVASALPLTRALEGVWLPRLASTDSERLLFMCVERMAGRSTLRLELRAGSPQGPVLRTIGDSQASERYTLIKSAEGYEAYRGERPVAGTIDQDLCRALVEVFSSARLQALGLRIKGAEGLREQVLALAQDDRQGLARRLWGGAPARWRQGGLRGGDAGGGYSPPLLRGATRGRYRRLYPSSDDQQFHADLSRWHRQGITPEIALGRLEARLQRLRDDLAEWSAGSPRRQRAVRPIIDAWHRDSPSLIAQEQSIQALDLAGLELTNEDIASLALPDDFRHVEELELSGNPQLSWLHPEFLERFPLLERLHLRDNRFAALPELAVPLRLISLDMQGNRITWDDLAQARLERSPNLLHLDLSENPLLRAPDIGNLRGLQVVSLDNASLTQLPQGLDNLSTPTEENGGIGLSVLDLSDNQFTALPQGVVFPEHVARAMELESDWLTPTVQGQIDAYYQAHGIDLLVADYQYEELLEGTNAAQQAIWQRLPIAYRRGLRAVLVNDTYMNDPDTARQELWRRLQRIDAEPVMHDYAMSQAAWRILELPM
ncbi:dermonecrotic toxin domain-containing protein [Pseudomonas oryziphila]|uniref:Leucine-rich repeat domain-containing protein n=1 Tax=Pseudomonas oryziphila TaxID=2894079 RepID=A0ABM7CQV3_9PSED|nr:DUF6543 domain-containing protein [Pseudomonas oryziphila]AZL73817.1 leucine-rich repeat domain-containing protein [Pseudomonas oryziphila]